MSLRFVALTCEERAELYPARARIWHGKLTQEEYCGRNRRLDLMPYARNGIQAFALKNQRGDVLASLDRLAVPFFVGGREREGGLIASFFTPPEFRGNGYGQELVRSVLAAEPKRDFVLFSEIAPAYYETFGFAVCPPASRWTSGPAESSLSLDAFLERLWSRRRGLSAALLPTPEYVEWHLERYRYFCELKGVPFRLDCTASELTVTDPFSAGGRETLWSAAGTACPATPMVRFARNPASEGLMDVQLLDAW